MQRDVCFIGSKLTFKITHRYNTYDFDGQKRLILSTSNWTGGKNTVIGMTHQRGAFFAECVYVLYRGCLFRHRCAFSRCMHYHSGNGSEIQSKARRFECALLEQRRKKGLIKDSCAVWLHCRGSCRFMFFACPSQRDHENRSCICNDAIFPVIPRVLFCSLRKETAVLSDPSISRTVFFVPRRICHPLIAYTLTYLSINGSLLLSRPFRLFWMWVVD